LSEIHETNIKTTKNEIENIFNKVSLVKSHTNDKMIFIREKLYLKFKDKNIVVTFCQAFCTQARFFQ